MKKISRKAVNILLSEAQHARFAEVFGTATAGVRVSATVYFTLRDRTLAELRGIFSEAELIGLYRSLVGKKRDEQLMTKPLLLAHVEDSEALDNLSGVYGFVYNELYARLKKLTEAQSYFLMCRIFELHEKAKPVAELIAELKFPYVMNLK
jgi:hypothetical protein